VQGAGWAALAVAGATALRARARPARLRAPEHLAELVAAADGAGPVTTSAGVRVSAGRATTPDGAVAHYTLSASPPLRPVEVRVLARQLRHLRHPDAPLTAVPGQAGVIHLVAAGG
jgi:hypothetical protein